MSKITPRQIEEIAQDDFEFLRQRRGCRQEERGEPWLFKEFLYVFDDMTVEVYIEYKDPGVDVNICRTVEGHAPPSALRVYKGQRVRVSLYEALQHGSEADRTLRRDLGGRIRSIPVSGPESIVPALHIFAEVLGEAIDRLPDYLDRLFVEA